MTQTATTQEHNEPEIQRVFQSKAETKAFYNKISHVYDLLAEHSEGPMRRAGLRETGNARPGEKVLEIGFGTGHCLVSLAQSGRADRQGVRPRSVGANAPGRSGQPAEGGTARPGRS